MNKIVQRQLGEIFKMPDVTIDMSNEDYLQISDKKTLEIIASVWETSKGDLMDYELYTSHDRVLKAAGIQTLAERINLEVEAKKSGE